jgi:hypothetical protein
MRTNTTRPAAHFLHHGITLALAFACLGVFQCPAEDTKTGAPTNSSGVSKTNSVSETSVPTNSPPETAKSNEPSGGLDMKSFEVVSKRNMFNPGRSPKVTSAPSPRPKRVETFTLTGTLSYDKGDFAIFEGTASEYRKSLKVSEKIAGYKIKEIAADHVILNASSNKTIFLPVGSQMRKIEGEGWVFKKMAEISSDNSNSTSGPGSATVGAAATTPSTSASSTGGDAQSDIIKRLMARRASEK